VIGCMNFIFITTFSFNDSCINNNINHNRRVVVIVAAFAIMLIAVIEVT